MWAFVHFNSEVVMRKSRDHVPQFISLEEEEQRKLLGACGACDMRQSIQQQKGLFLESVSGHLALILCKAQGNGGKLSPTISYSEGYIECTHRRTFMQFYTMRAGAIGVLLSVHSHS